MENESSKMATIKVDKHAVQVNKILENNSAYTRKKLKQDLINGVQMGYEGTQSSIAFLICT